MTFADYVREVAFVGGVEMPQLPLTFGDLQEAARDALDPLIFANVAGGAGDEHTQRLNVEAFDRWGGICPRVLRDVGTRDLSVDLFGLHLSSPLMLAPAAMIGPCAPDGRGDLAAAGAAAQTGIPMTASTIAVDPLEQVADALGDAAGFFQLYLPADRELGESLIQRAERGGFQGIVLTVDVAVGGWRPRDLASGHALYGRGLTYANFFSDPVFRSRLDRAPEADLPGASRTGDRLWQPRAGLERPRVAEVVHQAPGDRQRGLTP